MKTHTHRSSIIRRGLVAGCLGALALLGQSAQAGWVAFNDSAYKDGQINAPNVTTFGWGRNFVGEGTTGNLKDFLTGETTPVVVTYSETISSNSINSGGDAATYGAGSDAEGVFGGIVDISGNMSYGDSPGWSADLTITGLDPAKRYTFVGTANRNGGASYAARVTNWKLIGADAFVYASSPTAQKIGEDSVEFSTGDNSSGKVARWVDIAPGADGTIIIRTSHSVGEANGGIPGASAFQGYAGGVFSVSEQEPAWEAYNDSAYKDGQINAPNATTIGLGRNFVGQGTNGYLKVLQSGTNTPVIATYVETFSSNSINSGGDAATYAVGSDAEAIFGDKLDISGNMSYGDSPGWHADLVLTGLDPTKKYTFAGTANRNGGASYGARVTNWKIIGADAYTYASSATAHKVADDSVEFSTGDNSSGKVARWINIQPGSDGKIIIRTSHSVGEANGGIPGASAFQGYAGGVFMVRQQGAGDFRWAAYNDSSYKDGQINASFVTTIGLGRNFVGQGPSAALTNLFSGRDTGVTATYTETFSSNSINSAGDAATYGVGSDAEKYFKGIVDISGNMSYGDTPGWHLDLAFTGLDPSKSYTFVGTANRNGGAGYAPRVTNWKILGADSFTYGSSAGAHRVAEDAVEFSTGDNSSGKVARWVNIKPGADGTFVIRTSHSVGEANGGLPGASAFQGYAGGVFLLAEQLTDGGAGGDPIEIVSILPASGATNAHPNTPIVAVLEHGDAAVDIASVVLKVDGTAVTPLIVTNETSTTVSYGFPNTLDSASTHSVSLTFTDDGTPAVGYTNEWSFTVLDYSGATTIPSSVAIPFNASTYQERGFAMEIASPEPSDNIPVTNIDEAQAVFSLEYNNTIPAEIFNAQGYHIEDQVINYQIDQLTKGAKANDQRFPGVPGSATVQEQFALNAHTLLHLQPGYYRINITMTPGFKLFYGAAGSETELPFIFGPCANCGGDDAPWYTEILITQAGLYPFRLLYFSPAGSASLEWLTVSPTGTRPLVNENTADAVPAYVPLFALPPSTEVTMTIGLTGSNVSINWGGVGTLETATSINGPWSPVGGAANPYVTTAGDGQRYYRVAQ